MQSDKKENPTMSEAAFPWRPLLLTLVLPAGIVIALVVLVAFNDEASGAAAAFEVLAFAFGLYFAPAILAFALKRRQLIAIAVLNLFLGWTLIGWVVALVWACIHEQRKEV